MYAALGCFARPRWQHLAIAVALALAAPSVLTGLSLDDYVLLHQLEQPHDNAWAGSGPFDLFRWIDPGHARRLIDGAGLPWWTFEQTRLSFMRPVSSLTHALDHALWPRSPVLMHLHNLLWFGGLLVLCAALYRRLLDSRWVAGLAIAMYALDSTHAYAIGWIANRNALIAGVFGIATLLLHHRQRTKGGALAALGAWLCFALGVLSAELALAVTGYLFAYALCLERGRLLARVASLVPYAVLTLAWAAARVALEYGSYGLGAYVDPVSEPAAFLALLPVRAVVLMSSQLSRAAADVFDLAPPVLRSALLVWGVLVCAGALWFAWPALRARPALRFFALGSVLSLLPLTATLPNDRLLVLTGAGVMPVLAYAVHDALAAVRARGGLRVPRLLGLRSGYALLVLLVHLVVDPLLLPWFAIAPAVIAEFGERAERTLPADPALAGKTVIVAAVPDSTVLTYLPTIRAYNGRPGPHELYWLAATPATTRIERRAANVLRVSAPAGLFDRRAEARSPRFALRKGERVRVAEFTVEIVALTPDGRPSVCDFVFDEPLESPRYVWRIWQDDGLIDFTPPPPGRDVTTNLHGPKVAAVGQAAAGPARAL